MSKRGAQKMLEEVRAQRHCETSKVVRGEWAAGGSATQRGFEPRDGGIVIVRSSVQNEMTVEKVFIQKIEALQTN